ncbi:MAG: hypothetical protein PUA96_06765 [Bacteroidales bacterium]|nr:hypothetical protein [Bacteroidales bacterium]
MDPERAEVSLFSAIVKVSSVVVLALVETSLIQSLELRFPRHTDWVDVSLKTLTSPSPRMNQGQRIRQRT